MKCRFGVHLGTPTNTGRVHIVLIRFTYLNETPKTKPTHTYSALVLMKVFVRQADIIRIVLRLVKKKVYGGEYRMLSFQIAGIPR